MVVEGNFYGLRREDWELKNITLTSNQLAQIFARGQYSTWRTLSERRGMSVHFDHSLDFDCRFILLAILMDQNESAVISYCIARTMMSKDSRLFPVVI